MLHAFHSPASFGCTSSKPPSSASTLDWDDVGDDARELLDWAWRTDDALRGTDLAPRTPPPGTRAVRAWGEGEETK